MVICITCDWYVHEWVRTEKPAGHKGVHDAWRWVYPCVGAWPCGSAGELEATLIIASCRRTQSRLDVRAMLPFVGTVSVLGLRRSLLIISANIND